MHVLGIRFWMFIQGDFARNDVKVPAVHVQFKYVPHVATNKILQITSP